MLCGLWDLSSMAIIDPGPLVAQTVKNLLPMWEIWVQSLGQEDTLEKGMAGYPLQYSFLFFHLN